MVFVFCVVFINELTSKTGKKYQTFEMTDLCWIFVFHEVKTLLCWL